MTVLLTRTEAADRLRICTRTLKRFLAEGELEQVRIGRRSFVPADAVEQFIRRKRAV